MRACLIISSVLFAVVAPSFASAQETPRDELAPPVETAPSVEATVTVTTISEVAAPPTVVPPAPPTYVAPAPIAYVPPPVRDPSTRPSFDASIALHVTAAIAGPLGVIGLFLGTVLALGCHCGEVAAAFAITGGVLETASLAIGISATAVHGWTRARVREWEMGTARILPWGGPTGAGAALTLRF